MDRIWLDEELSTAVKEALQDCLSCLEPELKLYPEPVWERFLLSYQAFAGREGDASKEVFPAAVLATGEGMYPYSRENGWGALTLWEADRVRQVTLWLQTCVEQDSRSDSKGIPYEIRLPYSVREEWARTPGEYCLIALYEGEGKDRLDTGYYRLAVGGAQYRKRTLWYVQQTDGIPLYHRENCSFVDAFSKAEVYYRMEECAWKGALPCPHCN